MNQLRISLPFYFLSHTHFNSAGSETIVVRKKEERTMPNYPRLPISWGPSWRRREFNFRTNSSLDYNIGQHILIVILKFSCDLKWTQNFLLSAWPSLMALSNVFFKARNETDTFLKWGRDKDWGTFCLYVTNHAN